MSLDITAYRPDVISANDNYPFGMSMPQRAFSSSSYRYGFNGKEKDGDINSTGADYDYGFRIYDPRLSKFLSVDPLTNKYPELTPYQFAANMPTIAVDLDGEEAKIVTIYHSTRDGNEFFRTSRNINSLLGMVYNYTVTIHKYPLNTKTGTEWKQVGPAELNFENPINFQTGHIDLSRQTLGKLSEQFESHGVGTVSKGAGDHGGVSYGSWQLASNMNRPEEFLDAEGSVWAPEFKGLKSGTDGFSAKWKKIAKSEPDAFKNAQHDYIKRTHYDVEKANIQSDLGIDLDTRSNTLRDVAWSTAVQHGPGNTIFQNALKGQDVSKLTDGDIIKLVYKERGRKTSNGKLVYFQKSSSDQQKSVARRFVNEEKEAQKQLNK